MIAHKLHADMSTGSNIWSSWLTASRIPKHITPEQEIVWLCVPTVGRVRLKDILVSCV